MESFISGIKAHRIGRQAMWINTKDKLPKDAENIFFVVDNCVKSYLAIPPDIYFKRYDIYAGLLSDNVWYAGTFPYDTFYFLDDVKYWMPVIFPALPKEYLSL